MQTFTLTRTGDRPLEFKGETLAAATSEGSSGPAETRWHDITLYNTETGSIICAITYHTRWDGEASHYSVQVCIDTQDVAGWLRSYDPLAYLIGPPSGGPGSPQEQRQERLRKDLRLRYENVVSGVLGHLEPERVE